MSPLTTIVDQYLGAQLTSRRAALDLALEQKDPKLSQRAGADLERVASLLQAWYRPEQTVAPSTHRLQGISTLLADFNVEVQRQKRLPRVMGEEAEHVRLIRDLLISLHTPRGLQARVRRRPGRLIVSIQPVKPTSALARLVRHHYRDRYLITHLSLPTLQAYVTLRDLNTSGIAVRHLIKTQSLHISFSTASQLRMDLPDVTQ